MRLSLKYFPFTFIFGALSLAIGSVAFGQEDGGYHGPTWSTQPIPGVSTRAVSEGDVQRAMIVCTLTGDSARGIESMAQKLWKIIIRPGTVLQPSNELQVAIYSDTSDSRMSMQTESDFLAGKEGPQNHISYASGVINADPSVAFPRSNMAIGPTLRFSIGMSYHDSQGNMEADSGTYTPELNFPVLTYKKMIQSRRYDPFGRDVGDMIVEGLAIQLPPNYSTMGNAVKLTNETTGQPAAFTLNYHDWVACLSGELQRIP